MNARTEMETAIYDMLEAVEELFGDGVCDCRTEPENQGSPTCVWCRARAAVSAPDRLTTVESKPQELTMCEQQRLVLRPNTLYVFRVDENCERCVALSKEAE